MAAFAMVVGLLLAAPGFISINHVQAHRNIHLAKFISELHGGETRISPQAQASCTPAPGLMSTGGGFIDGPFGMGRGGEDFDDTPYTNAGLNHITRISWRVKGVITWIQFTYQGMPPVPAGRGSLSQGAFGSFTLGPNEFIVKARVAHRACVFGIVFITSSGRMVNVGVAESKWKNVVVSEAPSCSDHAASMKLVAISGKSTPGGCLEQIYLVWGYASTCPLSQVPLDVSVLGPAGVQPWGDNAIDSDFFPDPSAYWIWSSPDGRTDAHVDYAPLSTFVKRVTVPIDTDAFLHVIADDYAEVLLNGGWAAGVSGGWLGHGDVLSAQDPYADRPVRLRLLAGENIVAIRVTSTGGPAGLLAALYADDNTTLLTHTDDSWRYFSNPAASVLGLVGIEPWGAANVGPERFPDVGASWIWTSPKAATADMGFGMTPTFLIVVDTDEPTASPTYQAQLHIMADDLAVVYVNGQFVAPVYGGYTVESYNDRPLNLTLRSGLGNFVAIRVQNFGGGSAGLLASVSLPDGTLLARTDKSWAYTYEGCW